MSALSAVAGVGASVSQTRLVGASRAQQGGADPIAPRNPGSQALVLLRSALASIQTVGQDLDVSA